MTVTGADTSAYGANGYPGYRGGYPYGQRVTRK